MIAKAIASEAKARFFNISASSLTSKWIGESEKLARSLFALACLYQPSVIFIDEIDSILCKRSENENESSRRLKTEFLVQLDGAGTNQNDAILIIGATNRPQEIDDAVIRRMSKRLYIPLPDYVSRMELIKTVVSKEEQMGSKYNLPEIDLDEIVKSCKGYSGSDLMSVVREASMQPIRSIDDFNIEFIKMNDLRPVDKNDFIYALGSVKASVQAKTITHYEEWNNEFGSFKFNAVES